jgi:hypothetical protein
MVHLLVRMAVAVAAVVGMRKKTLIPHTMHTVLDQWGLQAQSASSGLVTLANFHQLTQETYNDYVHST